MQGVGFDYSSSHTIKKTELQKSVEIIGPTQRELEEVIGLSKAKQD